MLISIVTINKNNGGGLLKTIQSVITQSWQPLEYIVVDGGSTDNSMLVIQQYAPNISGWISEPDQGVYHAQNKGWKMAKGDYVLFLNSGDYFCSREAVEQLALQCTKKNGIVYGDLRVENTDGSYWLKSYPDKLPFNYFDYETLPHPATLIAIDLLRAAGGYDESLKICADWKFFRYLFLNKKTAFTHASFPTCYFENTGISSNPVNEPIIIAEKEKVKGENKKWKYQNLIQKVNNKILNPKNGK